MRARLLARLLVMPLGVALIALPVDTTVASSEQAGVRSSLSDVALSARSNRSAAEIRRYWSRDRMQAAKPMAAPRALGLGPDELLASAPASAAPASVGVRTVPRHMRHRGAVVPRTVGKLFVRSPYGDRMCTAAVIRSKQRNQILTAGHCVNGGKWAGWYRDWMFVPQYHNGRAPHGKWVARRAFAPWRWTHRSDFSRDYAIIKLRKLHGRKIQWVVGGNGVRTGRGHNKWGVRVWGWPAQSPYTGEHAVTCKRWTSRYGSSSDAKIRCPMTGGASGGPWLLKWKRKRHRGLIYAVTSRRTTSGTAYLLATPLPKAFWRLKRRANP